MGSFGEANGLHTRTTIGAVLLAAGAGSRLGYKPKALLEFGGVPLVVRQLTALSGAGVDKVVVVLGHHADAIESAIGHLPITIVRNPSPDDGQASSVRLGLQALSPPLDAVIVALADQPLITEADIVALIGAFRQRGDKAMVVPRVVDERGERQPGNPVIFDAALRDEWLAGSADVTCRKWRIAHPERVHWFDTDSRHYRIDIDSPEDLARFTAMTGHALQWPAHLAD